MVAWACTSQPAPSFPPPGPAQAAEETPPKLEKHLVGDIRQRWVIPFWATARPRRSEEQGYVRIDVPTGGQRDSYCFVYDAPLEPGQAVQRVLRAVSSGLRFHSVTLTAIEMSGDAPLLFFRAPYSTTLSVEEEAVTEEKGLFQIALAARSHFPVVCMHDEVGYEQPFRELVRRAAEGFSPLVEEPNPPDLREFWMLESKPEGDRGIMSFRAWEEEEQLRLLLVASQFHGVDGGLHATDFFEHSMSDERGLVRKDMVHLSGTEKDLQVSLERESETWEGGISYSYQGYIAVRPIHGEFSVTERLSADVETYSFFRSDEAKRSYQAYRPLSRVDGPVEVLLSRTSARTLESSEGETKSVIEFSDDGLVTRVRIAHRSHTIERTLMFRSGTPPF